MIVGKTHTVEFALGGIGSNRNGGNVRNPWDAACARHCGGSSAGAGPSLLMGTAVLALGSDTGGSIRVPASFTGTVGLKPTWGRWPADGMLPMSPAFDSAGALTRTVEDSVVAFGTLDPAWRDGERYARAIEGQALGDIVIGVPDRFFWDGCMPGIAEGVEDALAELERAGARRVAIELPEAEQAARAFDRGALYGVDSLAFLKRELPDWLATLDPNIAFRHEEARRVSALDYADALLDLRSLQQAADLRLTEIDVLAVPTARISPLSHEAVSTDEGYRAWNPRTALNARFVNQLALCGISFPVSLDALGLPVGLQLVVRNGQDERLLAVAWAAERALGSAAQRLGVPPLLR